MDIYSRCPVSNTSLCIFTNFLPTWAIVKFCLFWFLRKPAPLVFFFQAEDGIRDGRVTGVQTCDLPISIRLVQHEAVASLPDLQPKEDLQAPTRKSRSEEHTSELQSPVHLVCRLLLEKKKTKPIITSTLKKKQKKIKTK